MLSDTSSNLHNYLAMRIFIIGLLSLGTLTGVAQTSSVTVPVSAISRLEDVKELTKTVAVTKPTKAKLQAEARPEVNRLLVLAADDFVRITKEKPSKEAYLQAVDQGLALLAPLTTDENDRKDVAAYYQELLEIVGVESSEGRLTAFATSASKSKK